MLGRARSLWLVLWQTVNKMRVFTLIFTMILASYGYGQDLSDHLWHDRLIIVYADFDNEEGKRQIELLRNEPELLKERKVKIYFRSRGAYRFNFGMSTEISTKIEFDKPFKVELIGLDGGVKFSSYKVEPISVFTDLIDTMPMRKNELRNKG